MSHSPQKSIAPESRKQTILVIDDNPANLDTVTDCLAEYGFEVLVALNGEIGLERAQSVRPDLILLDVVMPRMDGFEVCQCLKADAATREIPVIFMTALTETEHKVRGFQVGAVDYVTKPMQREEVLARVLTHLRLRELNERLEQQVRERTDELVRANQRLQQEITERKQTEEALRKSEERFKGLFEQSPFSIQILDTNGWTLQVNKGWEQLWNSTPDMLANYNMLQDPQLEESGTLECLKKAFSGEAVRIPPIEYSVEKQAGKGPTRWVQARAFPIKDDSGNVREVILMHEDFTERKQTEEALRESEENYRTLVEQAKDGIAILQDASIQYVNQYLLEMGGYTAEEVIGSSFNMYVHPDEMARAADRYRQRMAGEPIPQIYESALRYRDGSKIEVEINASLITYRGRPADLVIIRDITARKKAETERAQLMMQIQEQAQRVQQIVDTVPEGVLLLDAEERVVLANPMAEGDLVALAGARVGDILTHLGGQPLAELLTSPPKGLWHELAADGQVFQVIARSLETGPTPGGWVLVIRDVTQQREFDRRVQQQERLAAVGQLAAGIAHDFNNIMATIVLYAQMTARLEELPASIRERMATISQQAHHATTLIRQILDFSRRSVLKRQPLDLLPLLKEQVQLLERTLPESIRIEFEYEPDEYIVAADLTSMQQMMTNLALNARDAMPQGGRLCIGLERIRIKRGGPSPLPEMKAGEWVRMVVSDTGVGVSPDVLPHIFEPFFTTKAPGKGSGLGLAQVHGIVGQHEGHIDVETQVGEGTTFVIYLPALPADPESSIAALLEESPSLTPGQGETILIVEDNAAARQVLVESLQLLNYRALEATNGQEALRILEQRGEEIALVLSDVVMPVMGGVALLHTLKERGLAVPVVMLTGHPVERELERLQTRGLINWLPKPSSLEQLAEVVAQALREEGKGSHDRTGRAG